MAFDGHPSTLANSAFSTHQGQASLNGDGENNERVSFSFLSIPSGSVQDRSSRAHDDPYGLISSRQSIKNSTDCDGETDLQGLVSNILDDADSQDSYYSEGSLPMCNSIWSPKTLGEELLQYLPSEAKVQHKPTFPPNYVSHDPFSKAQGHSVVKDVGQFCPHSSSLTRSQQWRFNLPNGDRDSSILQTKKLPPGLPLPNTGNAYLSQIQKNNCDKMSADRRNSQLLNDFHELSDAFGPHCEMNGPYFDPYYQDHYTQNSRKSIGTEQCVPKDINQLVNSFQSLVTDKRDSVSKFPNINKQMHHGDSTTPPISTQTLTGMQTQKRQVGELRITQREQNGALRKQRSLHRDFQDLPRFSPCDIEYFQQPKEISASLKFPNKYQNNITMDRENINMNISQYQKHDIEQGQTQNKIMPQVQKMHMFGVVEDGISARLLTNTHTREGEKKMAPAKNSYFELQGSMQSQQFDRMNSVSAKNTQQFMPPVYPVNEPRRCSNLLNNSRFNARSSLPHGSGLFPGMDVGDTSDSAALNFYTSDMMTCKGEITSNGMALSLIPPVVTQEGLPELNFFLDECHEQWRCLEKEIKRIEVVLSKTFHGKWTAAVTNATYANTPPNPTRVDNLIIKQIREEAKAASLLERMESLCNTPLQLNIHTALNRHHMAICITQARRKEELANTSKHQQQKAERDTLLVFAINDLAATTRKLRTALWCALEMTLPTPVKRQHHNYEEVTCNERCSSPFEGYSFRL